LLQKTWVLEKELEVYCLVFLLWIESWNSISVKPLSYIVAHHMLDKNTKSFIFVFVNFELQELSNVAQVSWKMILGLSILLLVWFGTLTNLIKSFWRQCDLCCHVAIVILPFLPISKVARDSFSRLAVCFS